jgi:Protein of unknown function (DUF3306)
MASNADETGFLSRWARRKAQARQGTAPDDPAAPALPAVRPAVDPAPATAFVDSPGTPASAPGETEPEPAPTLADVAELTHESDYTRFVVRGVQPDVKNAALKKLFSDPHFNVMDGLDTYIEDYGRPDPLPEGMLRRMVQSEMLGLFADEEQKSADPAPAGSSAPETEIRAAPQGAFEPAPEPTPKLTPTLTPESAPDEDTDLQLQPDDDAGRTGAEPGAGEDARRQH